jgi:hypothetical protein
MIKNVITRLGYLLAIIMLIFYIFKNKQLNTTNLQLKLCENKIKMLLQEDTTSVKDTIILETHDSIYFTINNPVYIKYKDTIKTTITKIQNKFDTVYIIAEKDVNIYQDSIINKDGKFYSTIITEGKIYDNNLNYVLFDTTFSELKTIVRIDTIKTEKRNNFQLYSGFVLKTKDFKAPLINYGLGISTSVIIREDLEFSYDYDVINSFHSIAIKKRLF